MLQLFENIKNLNDGEDWKISDLNKKEVISEEKITKIIDLNLFKKTDNLFKKITEMFSLDYSELDYLVNIFNDMIKKDYHEFSSKLLKDIHIKEDFVIEDKNIFFNAKLSELSDVLTEHNSVNFKYKYMKQEIEKYSDEELDRCYIIQNSGTNTYIKHLYSWCNPTLYMDFFKQDIQLTYETNINNTKLGDFYHSFVLFYEEKSQDKYSVIHEKQNRLIYKEILNQLKERLSEDKIKGELDTFERVENKTFESYLISYMKNKFSSLTNGLLYYFINNQSKDIFMAALDKNFKKNNSSIDFFKLRNFDISQKPLLLNVFDIPISCFFLEKYKKTSHEEEFNDVLCFFMSDFITRAYSVEKLKLIDEKFPIKNINWKTIVKGKPLFFYIKDLALLNYVKKECGIDFSQEDFLSHVLQDVKNTNSDINKNFLITVLKNIEFKNISHNLSELTKDCSAADFIKIISQQEKYALEFLKQAGRQFNEKPTHLAKIFPKAKTKFSHDIWQNFMFDYYIQTYFEIHYMRDKQHIAKINILDICFVDMTSEMIEKIPLGLLKLGLSSYNGQINERHPMFNSYLINQGTSFATEVSLDKKLQEYLDYQTKEKPMILIDQPYLKQLKENILFPILDIEIKNKIEKINHHLKKINEMKLKDSFQFLQYCFIKQKQYTDDSINSHIYDYKREVQQTDINKDDIKKFLIDIHTEINPLRDYINQFNKICKNYKKSYDFSLLSQEDLSTLSKTIEELRFFHFFNINDYFFNQNAELINILDEVKIMNSLDSTSITSVKKIKKV